LQRRSAGVDGEIRRRRGRLGAHFGRRTAGDDARPRALPEPWDRALPHEDRGREIPGRIPRRLRAHRQGHLHRRHAGGQHCEPPDASLSPHPAPDVPLRPGHEAAGERVSLQPTRVRFSVVALALLLNVVSYTDRACISVVGPNLRSTFGLSPTELGLVFGSFSLSYALLQAPWGALADRKGSRGIVA